MQVDIFLYFGMQKYMDLDKRNWYLSPMRAAKVQASLRICEYANEAANFQISLRKSLFFKNRKQKSWKSHT